MFFYTWSALIVLFPLRGMLWCCDMKKQEIHFVPSSWHRASKTLGISWVIEKRGASFILTISPFQLHLSLYYRNDVFGKSLRMGLVARRTNQKIRGMEISVPSPRHLERRWGWKCNSVTRGQWSNPSYLCNEALLKTPKERVQRASGLDTLGQRWLWKGHGNSTTLPTQFASLPSGCSSVVDFYTKPII